MFQPCDTSLSKCHLSLLIPLGTGKKMRKLKVLVCCHCCGFCLLQGREAFTRRVKLCTTLYRMKKKKRICCTFSGSRGKVRCSHGCCKFCVTWFVRTSFSVFGDSRSTVLTRILQKSVLETWWYCGDFDLKVQHDLVSGIVQWINLLGVATSSGKDRNEEFVHSIWKSVFVIDLMLSPPVILFLTPGDAGVCTRVRIRLVNRWTRAVARVLTSIMSKQTTLLKFLSPKATVKRPLSETNDADVEVEVECARCSASFTQTVDLTSSPI